MTKEIKRSKQAEDSWYYSDAFWDRFNRDSVEKDESEILLDFSGCLPTKLMHITLTKDGHILVDKKIPVTQTRLVLAGYSKRE